MWTHSHRVVSLDLICLNPSALNVKVTVHRVRINLKSKAVKGHRLTNAHCLVISLFRSCIGIEWAPHNCFSILFYVSPSLSLSGCLVLSFTHSPCLSYTLSNIASTHSDTVMSAKIFFRHTQETQNYFFCCCCCFLLHSPSPLCSHPQLSLLVRFPRNISALSSFFQLSSVTEPVATECVPPAEGDASHAVQAACACHSLPHPQGSSTALYASLK